MTRKFKSTLLAAAISVSFNAVATTPSSITVYTAQDVITMSEHVKTANAVAVKDGFILDVGSQSALVSRYQDNQGFKLDKSFADKVITPGFVEPHAHIWLFALVSNTEFITPADWQLPWGDVKGVVGHDNYIKRLTELEAGYPKDEPLVTWGYHSSFHGEVTRATLDKISTTRPIVVWQRSVHELIFNTAALEMFDITKESWTGEGESYDMVNWENGHAWEKGLYLAAPALLQLIATPEKYAHAIKRTHQYLQAGGITTVVDPGVQLPKPMIKSMITAMESDQHMLDYFMIPAGNSIYDQNGKNAVKALQAVRDMVNDPELNGQNIKWLDKQIKLFADGAAFSQLMQMKDGYLDGHVGEWIQTPEDLRDSLRAFWDEDYTIVVHVNGDKGLEVAVDSLELANSAKPRKDHRTGFHHLAFTDPIDIKRAVDLDANFSVNPFYLHVLGEQYSKVGVGPERSSVMARGRSFIDTGAPLSFHSDAPMAPGRPLALAWTAVNRTGLSGEVLGPEERMTMQESMRAMTINGAYQARLENEIGSIDIGKRANFTILSEHPYQVKPENIKDITVWGTVFDGQIIETERLAQGLVLDQENLAVMNMMAQFDGAHNHNHALGEAHTDSCTASLLYQDIMKTM
ncbi:MAG: amidohydrolase [Moritella sp.]|uniref:amidohydrolase n=1 Tax=Moritella sp. TaxID=78556 RepID=UPI0029A48EDB|nr:amidohydrolase [Moritella sp.]MDX2321034.1 amidohydrolase [Moritella sp.]